MNSLEERRQALRNQIPKQYNPIIHWLGTIGVSVLICILMLLHGMKLLLFYILPVTIVAMLIIEYVIHRYLLHRNIFSSLYRFHQHHHVLFNESDMNIESLRDLYWVLIPLKLYAILSFILLIGFTAVSLTTFLSPDILASIVFSIMFSHILYDTCHTLWHTTNFSLGKFHRKHHSFKLMQHYNFNVTFPLVDLIVRTLKR